MSLKYEKYINHSTSFDIIRSQRNKYNNVVVYFFLDLEGSEEAFSLTIMGLFILFFFVRKTNHIKLS